jgi:PAS domain S-box-containing protein
LDYTGLSAEQAQDWTWTTAIHPDDLNGLTDYWRSILDSGEPGEFEARLRRFDGEYRWFLFRASPLGDRSGTVVKWYGTNTGIDDRKRAEDELRASEHNFRLIVDSIPGLVCTMSAVGEVEFLNRQVLEYFGKTVEELKGWATGDVIHPDDLPRVIATFTNSVAAGQPYGIENRYRRADGSYRWFEFRALPARDAAGRILRWYALLIDIDDRKQMEEKLRESEAVLLEAQQLSHTGSRMHDPATGRTWQSPELLRIFGVNPNEEDASSGETFIARIHPEDAPIEAANYARAQEAKKDFEGDYRIVLLDGSIRRIHNVAHPKLDESGNLIGFVGIAMDVTEQWQARTNLERAFEEIKILKDRLHDENLALREQIDQGFMFEEIVGSSPALQRVLSSVAPTDSTVLITKALIPQMPIDMFCWPVPSARAS